MEQRVKPQGGYVFRRDVDVFRTSIRTATGTGTKQQEGKTRSVREDETRRRWRRRWERENKGNEVTYSFNTPS